MGVVDIKTTKISLITIVTMHCMQNGISLQHSMVRMYVMVLVGQLNEWLFMQACSHLSLDKYCHQSLYSSLPNLKYLVFSHFGFPLQKSLKTNILKKGLRKSSTLPGSRSNHFFRPPSDSREIVILLVSGEEAVPVNILNFMIHNLKIGDCVAYNYELDFYAGTILDISVDNGDVYVKLMNPKGPSMLFKWPSKEDESWVVLNNAIKVLKPPNSNQSGRSFTFDESDIKDVISVKNFFFSWIFL